jgi:hypothetical protein
VPSSQKCVQGQRRGGYRLTHSVSDIETQGFGSCFSCKTLYLDANRPAIAWKSVRLLLRRGLTRMAVRCYVGRVRVRSLDDPAEEADAERLL